MAGLQSWGDQLGPENWLGKTDAQIVAMGRKGWEAYSRSHHGWWKAVDYVYADAAEKRNLALLQRPGVPQGKDGRKLHEGIEKLVRESCELGYLHDSFNGRGTIEGRLAAAAEDSFYAYLRPKGQKRAEAMVVSDVTRAIDKIFSEIGDESEGQSAEGSAEIHKLKAELKSTYREIVAQVAKTTDRRGSDRILSFCRLAVDTIKDEDAVLGK